MLKFRWNRCLFVAGVLGCCTVSLQETAPVFSQEKSAEAETAAKSETTQEKTALNADQQKVVMERLAGLSKEAKTAKEYSAMLQQCEAALEANDFLSANAQYIRSLIAWASNRRGELRMELGFEFHLVGNQDQSEVAFQEAASDFDRAIAEDETHWKAYLNRGIIASHQKDWDAAIDDLKKSSELRPSQTFAYFNLAEIEYQRQHYQAALAYYDHILKSSENDAQALNGRALTLVALQRFNEAMEIYDQLLEHRTEDAWLLTNKADLLQIQGQWSEAEKTYIEALKLEQAAPIYRRLAWLFATCPEAELRQREGSLQLAKKAISLSRKTTAVS